MPLRRPEHVLGVVAAAPGFAAHTAVRLAVVALLVSYVLASLPPLSQAARHTVDGPLFVMERAEWLYERARRYNNDGGGGVVLSPEDLARGEAAALEMRG